MNDMNTNEIIEENLGIVKEIVAFILKWNMRNMKEYTQCLIILVIIILIQKESIIGF